MSQRDGSFDSCGDKTTALWINYFRYLAQPGAVQSCVLRADGESWEREEARLFAKALCSFEALARWIDPEYGVIYPNEFIPVLEREGLIHLLDTAILRQVCAQIRSSIVKGETPIPVSVNLSRLDFTLCDIFTLADDIVSDYQIPHDFVYFEITESVMAERKDLMMGIVNRFRSAGYQIWMDDFGSAYSSLNALKEFDFDELKLDMSFLRPINLRSKRIVTAIVKMAKVIDAHTLSEGVETEEQFAYLRDIGCEKVQGYLFGKPMPHADAIANMREQGIRIEPPQDRYYYDEVGKIDFLSAVPFMTRGEYDDIDSARQLNSISLTLAEFYAEGFKVLFYNTAFEEMARSAGMFTRVFTQEMLCQLQPYHMLTRNVVNLMDSVKVDGEGKMLFTINDQYFEIKARRMAQTKDKFCALVSITNLTKDTQTERTGYLDDSVRQIYALYERITLSMSHGESKEILASKIPLYDANGEIVGLLGHFIDKCSMGLNDRQGEDITRRDLLTGLLNSRGLSEEAEAFRDEYYLWGTDFVRIHIGINDFNTINDQYGFDFGDKVLDSFGQALRQGLGLRSAIGHYAGRMFTVLQQVGSGEEAHELRERVKAIGDSVREVDGKPITLYLSVGYALYSEYLDIEEQAKYAEVRLHADYDQSFSAESRIDHASELFCMFDDLPVPYAVFHVAYAERSGRYDAVFFYANHKYEEFTGLPMQSMLGHTVRELFPYLGDDWYQDVKSAALDGNVVEGEFDNPLDGRHFRFTARQIIYPGYCAITCVEVPVTRTRRHILIADDIDVNREILGDLLSDDYNIYYASDGIEALEMLQKHEDEIALLMLDLYMPNMTGWEVLVQMQADERLAAVPVIVFTVDHEAEVRALKMGAMDFIPKPYPDIETVKARIAKCIALSQRS